MAAAVTDITATTEEATPNKQKGPLVRAPLRDFVVRPVLLPACDVGGHFHRDFYDFEFRLGPHSRLRR
jgi:hypothetical protein